MQTVLVSGNDTDVGKTHVLGQLAGTLAARGLRVQIVKLVETGMPADTSPGDADRALAAARKIAAALAKTASTVPLDPAASHGTKITVPLDKGERARKLCSAKRSGKGVLSALLSAFRLARFTEPLAPTEAARRDGAIFSVENLCEKMRALPPCDVRLIEGAGGLAVPVDDSGRDWADFARAVADATLLVVENRLGGICQARFLAAYCAAKRVPAPYFWLNEIREQSEGVLASNAREIPKIGIPVLGMGTPHGTFSVVPAALDSLLRARESK